MKFIVISLLSILLFTSCHDMKKQKQLNAIETLISDLESMSVSLNEMDSTQINIISTEVNEIRTTIQNNYQADTLSVEIGQQLEDFKLVGKKAKFIAENLPFAKENAAATQLRLNQLHQDIRAGHGEREKYDSYIQNERKQILELKNLHQTLLKSEQEVKQEFEPLKSKMLEYNQHLTQKQ